MESLARLGKYHLGVIFPIQCRLELWRTNAFYCEYILSTLRVQSSGVKLAETSTYYDGFLLSFKQVISERDILGTQLVRRNDELALLYEKIKIQQSTLNKGMSLHVDSNLA
jgi:hypothetical protein